MNMQNDSVKKSMGWGKLDEAWSQFVSLKKNGQLFKNVFKGKTLFRIQTTQIFGRIFKWNVLLHGMVKFVINEIYKMKFQIKNKQTGPSSKQPPPQKKQPNKQTKTKVLSSVRSCFSQFCNIQISLI